MKKKGKLKEKLKKFFNSIHVIIAILIIIILILIYMCYHLMSSSKTYMFSGDSDYVSILNGVVSLNYDVNLLEGSDIQYVNASDYTVTDYKIGYYVVIDGNLKEIAVKSGDDDQGLSLKTLVEEVSSLNITEPTQNKYYFSSAKIKALENDGLYFVIEATDINGNQILDKTELSLSKVSR